MTRLRQFTSFISDRHVTPMYKSLVDGLHQVKNDLDKMDCKVLGVHVSQPEKGTYYYIQMALAPIRTVDTIALPWVLVQFPDNQTLNQWLKENDRQVIIKLDKGFGLTCKQVQP
ncbi:hypothetical protein JYU15_02125 [bacterium AH-315-I18]|nr:hypothetical protein [bacterium AH-315-I18]